MDSSDQWMLIPPDHAPLMWRRREVASSVIHAMLQLAKHLGLRDC